MVEVLTTEGKEHDNMSLSRKFLTAMGIEDDKVEEIIKAHRETVDSLKEEAEQYKENADKAEKLEKELAKATKKVEELEADAGEDKYKVKYDALKEEFDKYKSDLEAKATKESKEKAYEALLKEAGVGEKRIAKVLAVSGKEIDGLELESDGTAKGKDELVKAIKEEWADFIETTQTKGANTTTPPGNTGGGKMSKDDIRKIQDPIARQKAMVENKELFGL